MPVRPRRRRVGRAEWSPTIALALTIGPRPGGAFPDDATLRRAWGERGAHLTATDPAERPWGWWEYEGPPELRGGRPALHPSEDAERVEAERVALERRRARWLAEHDPHP